MEIIGTIKENLEAAGQFTAELAKKTAEAIRLRDQIRRDNKEIRKLTYEIGQTYLRLHADDYDEVYKEFIEGIASAKADIEDKMNQLAALNVKNEDINKEEAAANETEEAEEEWDDLFDTDAQPSAEGETTADNADTTESPEAQDEADAATDQAAVKAEEAAATEKTADAEAVDTASAE